MFPRRTGSHTHEPGHALGLEEWHVSGRAVVSTTTTLSTDIGLLWRPIELDIFDDHQPPNSEACLHDVRLVMPDHVPGLLASYYDASASGASALLDAVPASADFVEQRSTASVGGTGQVGGSPFTGNVLVRLSGGAEHLHSRAVHADATGGAGRRLFVDGVPAAGQVYLSGARVRGALRRRHASPISARHLQTLGGTGVPLDEDVLRPLTRPASRPDPRDDRGGRHRRRQSRSRSRARLLPAQQVVVLTGATAT